MRARIRLLALLAVLPPIAGCSSAPAADEHFYRLSRQVHPPPEPGLAATRPRANLLFAGFTIAPALAGDRLVASVGPVRLEPYASHRWIAPLELLLNESALEQLAASGCFLSVLPLASRSAADWVVRGHVTEFFERDAGDRWFGDAALTAELVDASTGAVAWREDLRASVAAERRHPESVVEALSRAWAEVLAKVAEGSATALAGRPR